MENKFNFKRCLKLHKMKLHSKKEGKSFLKITTKKFEL